ncbi:unnamed protein product [Didymodactylos carnosus]|uniref:Uncharacterized protein n=1 Tax=Didymodactylos carnosus TaxID=1234261 RepID=A0A814DBJ4_9BILA|nr:unnamed protein product [Didymodactylos carnosus]CAF1176052.1 unnamed protein product [Didymodactylos carnosus]CAF3728955.1 unnamed protein product [Didymodactylos carnosus]CAF3987223.1 unnamed protein product [Didymodactylos carnosus]
MDQLQNTISATSQKLVTLQGSLFNVTQTTLELAKRFERSEYNTEQLEKAARNTIAKMKNFQDFTDDQIRYNIAKDIEHRYERLKSSMHRIANNELNFDFIGMSEQNELIETAYLQLKDSIPTLEESKSTFVTRMLFAQTVQFGPINENSSSPKVKDLIPKQMGSLVFTNYFMKLKISGNSTTQIYYILTIPSFTGKNAGEISSLPKLLALGEDGSYMEWMEKPDSASCDIGKYTICRNPSVSHDRIQNECLEEIIAGKGLKKCYTKPVPYSPPYVARILPGVVAISTNKNLTCVVNSKHWQNIRSLGIVNLGCEETLTCENNISFAGEKRCRSITPYVLQTKSDDILRVVDRVKNLNVNIPKVYPRTGDMDLVKSLEDQLASQQQNVLNWTFGSLKLKPHHTISIILSTVIACLILMGAAIILYKRRCQKNTQPSQSSPTIQLTTLSVPNPQPKAHPSDTSLPVDDLIQLYRTESGRKNKIAT